MSGTGTLTLEDIVSLGDFQQLLSDGEFVDFFNKFICLPAFSQLVQIHHNDCRFLLYPPLPDSYTVNKKGLVEWLWRKRLSLFVKSKFFGEYRLSNILVHHSFVRERLESSQTKHVKDCLKWLQRRSLGRVSNLRRFRRFLRDCEDGLKLYFYWLDAERLYFHIKLRSSAAIEVFKSVKVKYFTSESDTKMPQHLLDEALECLPPYHTNKGIATDAVCYDVTFAMCLQRICTSRLQGYWLPRFLLDQTSLARNMEEAEMLDTARKYLRGTLESETKARSQGSRSTEATAIDSACPSNQHSTEGGNRREIVRNERASKGHGRQKPRHRNPGAIAGSTKQKPRDEHRRRVFIKDPPQPLGTSDTDRCPRKGAGAEQHTSSSENEEDCNRRIRSMKARSRERRARRKASELSRPTSGCESDRESESDSMEDKNSHGYDGNQRSRGQKIDSTRDRRMQALRKRKLKYDNLFADADPHSTPSTAAEKLKEIYKDVDDNRRDLFEEYDSELTRFPLPRLTKTTKSQDMESKPNGKTVRYITTQNRATNQSDELTAQDGAERDLDAHSVDMSEEEFSGQLYGKPWSISSLDSLKSSRRNLLAMKQSKSSRRGISPPRLDDAFAQSNSRRRKSTVTKLKPKKPAAFVKTKVTFSLSGGKPAPPASPEKSAKPAESSTGDRKILKQEKIKKRRISQRIERKHHLLPDTMPAPAIAMTEYTMDQDNAYRRHPDHARMILAFQSDQCACQPFRTFLLVTDNEDLVCSLSFWQDVEKSRQDFQYGMMSFQNFVHSMQKIVRTYLSQTSPCRIDASIELCEQAIKNCMAPEMHEMPWQMRKLQKEAMDDLKPAYREFAEHEARSFFNAAAFKKAEAGSQTTTISGLFPPVVDQNDNSRYDITDCYEQASAANAVAAQMMARMMRSLDYLIETNLPDGRDFVIPTRIESDEDDNVELPATPRYVVDPPIDYKELAAHSVRQYPGVGFIGKPFNAPRASRRQTTVEETPKKIQAAIERPVYRPKTFEEVLRDQAHLHFFNRYLKAYRADIPLRFWNAVERMSRIERNRVKHIQARKIANKYFHNQKTHATVLLQTDSDIIKDIAKREIIPTNRLFMARAVVERELEERWFDKYANTFLDIPVQNSRYDLKARKDEVMMYRNRRLKGIWSVIRVFIKRAGSFLRNMRKPHMFELFEKFLQRAMDESTSPTKSEGAIDVFDNRSDSTLSPLLYLRRDWDTRVKQRVIHGRLITFNFLANDLHFWRDVECFRNLVTEFGTETELSPDAMRENILLRGKAKLIVSCYLESDILPKVRVNISPETAKVAAESLRNGAIEYGLFHEATVMIFPVLLDFWRRFCTEHYSYIPTLSRKHQKIFGYKMKPAIAEQRKSTKKPSTHEEGGDGKRSPARLKSSTKYLHMDQVNFTRKGTSAIGLDDMGLRLTFSIRQGVTLIQPTLRKRINGDNSMGFADIEDTRGKGGYTE